MPLRATKSEWNEAEREVLAYGRARGRFMRAQGKLGWLLTGNDNKVGVAGEFWAKWIFHSRGWSIERVEGTNNPGFDFVAVRSKRVRVSVKVITDESRSGKQMRLREPWDCVCIVLLSHSLALRRSGIATRSQFDAARSESSLGSTPRVSRTWLNPRGWINRYGETQNWA